MAKKGPSLSKNRYGSQDDYDYSTLLSDASEEEIIIEMPQIPESLHKKSNTEDYDEDQAIDNLLGLNDMSFIEVKPIIKEPISTNEPETFITQVQEEVIKEVVMEEPKTNVTPKQLDVSIKPLRTTDENGRKLNFNEIQDPVVWGSNVINREIIIDEEVSKEEPEEIEKEIIPEPEENTGRRRRTSKPVHLEEDAPEPIVKKKEKPLKQKKEKLGKIPRERKTVVEPNIETFDTSEENNDTSLNATENIETLQNDNKGKNKKPKKEKKKKDNKKTDAMKDAQVEINPENDKKYKKIYKKYPKKYYDPVDSEVDEKDGKTYYYFNPEKTLRKYNLLFLTKIIPLYKLEELTDSAFFDETAKKQHEKVEKLNALSAVEQYKREKKINLIRIGVMLALIFFIFSHVTNTVIPNNKFENATKNMIAGNYRESFYTFSELGTRSNSHIYAKYDEGQVFLQIAKSYSSGTAGRDLTDEEKQANINEAILNYDSAKECFKLLENAYNAIAVPFGMSDEEAYKHITNLIKECDYSKARMLYQNSKFEEAAAIFRSIYDYSDATENYYRCMYEIADNYYEDGDYFLAIDNFYPASVAKYSDAETRLKELASQLYESASIAFQKKDYEQAIEYFAFLADYNYSDSADMINRCRYNYALDFYKAKNYEKALDYLKDIEEYKDALALEKECTYRLGVIAYNRVPVSSIEYFKAIPGFRDADNILNSNNLILYGSWKVVEMDGNAIPDTEFYFNGDGALVSTSVNLLGVAISKENEQEYYYRWNGSGYSIMVDNTEYVLSLRISDADNIYIIASNGSNEYTYKCQRTLGYLEMLAQNKENEFDFEESLTLNQRLTIIIKSYINLKTDGMYEINGVMTDVSGVKSYMNSVLQQEVENDVASELTEE